MHIEIDGYNINYRESGTGEEYAVILQGWGTQLSMYDTVADILKDRYRLLQFDFPGFGDSDEPKEAWNVDAFADFFIKLMQALDIHSATLIGHSYGGRVIIKLAARAQLPFTITNIVLIDSAGIVPEKTAAQKRKIRRYKIMKKIYDLAAVNVLFPELVEDWKSRQGSADYRNATPIMRQCLVMAVNEDLRHLLPAIRQDVLLIWGDKDTATPLSDAQLMERMLPACGLAVIPNAGHFPFLEQPGHFRSVLAAYLNAGGEA